MAAHSLPSVRTAWPVALSGTRLALRDRTVVFLAAMFFAMVLVSAYLGWSATETVNAIYAKAVPALQARGLAVPPNPVGEMPALSLFRNMVTYVALLGALASLVLGHQTIAADRKSGILPLLFSRPVSRSAIAAGKIAALAALIAVILLAAALINVLTMLILPGLDITGAVWTGLMKFYGVSALYMLAFGLLGALCAACFATESMALLVPVTVWLALTFILPQITANIGPMAALNPVSANLVPPSSAFFTATSTLLGPLSIAEAYRYLAASVLEIASGAGTATTAGGALASLLTANFTLAAAFTVSINRLDASRSDYRD
jgi:ABC-type transport system involved in multi-copper enzyme maturation permease subunit